MKKLLLSAVILASCSLQAQTILNGNFENWNSSVLPSPQYYYFNSNYQATQLGMQPNAVSVADPQQGSLAVKLTTATNGQDTLLGYIVNGNPDDGSGGIPMNQTPTTLSGYYKSAIPAGDTAILIVFFKSAGVVVSTDVYQFYGTHSTYTAFNMPLNVPSMVTVDSVIIGAASSNAFVSSGIPGSMLQLDNLAFTGVSTQPANLNGSFENWNNQNLYTPAGWTTAGDTVLRTSDAHGGNYAIALTTVQYDPQNAGPSYVTNGQSLNFGPGGGRPYALMMDTLCGWYKYIPNGVDSATIWIQTMQGGNPVGGAYTGLPPVSVYTYFEIPFASGATPDTLLLVAASTYSTTNISNAGSRLYLDDLQLKSSPLSVQSNWAEFGLVKISPNPARENVRLEWNNRGTDDVVISISDMNGKLVYTENISASGNQRLLVNTSEFGKGVYLVSFSSSNNRAVRKLVIE